MAVLTFLLVVNLNFLYRFYRLLRLDASFLAGFLQAVTINRFGNLLRKVYFAGLERLRFLGVALGLRFRFWGFKTVIVNKEVEIFRFYLPILAFLTLSNSFFNFGRFVGRISFGFGHKRRSLGYSFGSCGSSRRLKVIWGYTLFNSLWLAHF